MQYNAASGAIGCICCVTMYELGRSIHEVFSSTFFVNRRAEDTIFVRAKNGVRYAKRKVLYMCVTREPSVSGMNV
jgi:hypothetical protein